MKSIRVLFSVRICVVLALISWTASGQTPQFTEVPIPHATSNSSVTWGDFDNDGDPDVLVTGIEYPSFVPSSISKVFRNDGEGTFTDIAASLLPVYGGSSAWGDYDNDGDLDILLTGTYMSGMYSTAQSMIYRNDGGGIFSSVGSPVHVSSSSVAWGDYDNDGDLDFLLSGIQFPGNASSIVSKIYRNDSGSGFTDIAAPLIGVMGGSVAWGDYDNDGDLDILMAGSSGGTTGTAKIYRNDGPAGFIDIATSLAQIYIGAAAWGDCDNDGDLDILLTGRDAYSAVSRVYRNDGGLFNYTFYLPTAVDGGCAWGDYDNDGDLDILMSSGDPNFDPAASTVCRNDNGSAFVNISAPLPAVRSGSVAWVDFDNDDDLDVILDEFGSLYSNNSVIANTVPLAPVGLTSTNAAGSVQLNWNKATDSQSAQNALTYNLRIGTVPGGVNVESPMADIPTGYRRITALGNTNHNSTWTVNGLTPGTYYWSVQAIDNAFAAGSFAAEQSFVINTPPVAVNDTFTVDMNDTLTVVVPGVLGNDSDPDSNPLTVAVVSSVAHGSLTLNTDGSFEYLPSTSYVGVDQFSYQADDGNAYDTAIVILSTYDNRPVASQTANPNPAACNQTVSFDASASSHGRPDRSIVSYAWDFGDGNTGTGQMVNHAFDHWGTFTVTLTVADNNIPPKTATTTTIVTVNQGNQAPTANAGGPYTADLGNGITLDGSGSSDPNTSCGDRIVRYEWDINNDGTYEITSSIPTTALDAGTVSGLGLGTHTIRLKVMDTFGTQGTAATTLAVNQTVHHFAFATIASPQTAGTPFSVTITAQDINNNTVTGFTGTIDLSTTAGTTTPLISGVFVNGQWTGNISVSTEGTGRTITATRTGGTETGRSNAFDVVLPLFSDINANLPPVVISAAVWGDYDNDGDLDIAISGNSSSADVTRIYRNDGGAFTNVNAPLVTADEGALAWGDFDNDNDLDLLTTGQGVGLQRETHLYRNNAGSFVHVVTGMTNIGSSAIAWGDYDSDGDLDALLAGSDGYRFVTKLYRNTAGNFSEVAAGLRGMCSGSADFVDYDNDGDLDIMISGSAEVSYYDIVTKLYRNTNGTFTEVPTGLPGLSGTSIDWADFDADGDLDLLIAGGPSPNPQPLSRVYRNDSGTLTDINAGLTGTTGGFGSSWGDYDNDGDLDILLIGNNGTTGIAKLYNNVNGTFAEVPTQLPGITGWGSVGWGDYDADGDLDILLTGNTTLGPTAKVYRNNLNTPNPAPSSPDGLNAAAVGQTVTIGWNAASDTQTPANGLSYHLRVGTTPGGSQILSPMAQTTTGFRRLSRVGIANGNRNWKLKNLPLGTYYWSVQAIDNSFAGGPFAAEQTFVVVGPLHHFAFSLISSPQAAGQQFGIAITAQDVNNNTVTDFTGTVDLTTTAGIITPAVSDTFVNGQRTIDIIVTEAGPGKTITAIKTGGTEAGTSNAFDVNPGGIHHFAFAAVSSAQTAGIPFEVTITALDSIGNLVNDFGGTVDLTTNAGVILPAVSGAFTNGRRTEMVAVSQAGPDKQVAASLTGGTQAGVSNLFNVIHGALHHYALGTITSPQTAGVSFNITITARDSLGNTVLYPDTVGLTTTAGTITPLVSPPLVDGQTTFSVRVTLADTGRSITATRLSGTCSGRSNPFDVGGGSLHHFAFGLIGNPQTSGVAFDITLIAQDEYNNTAKGFVETVALSTSAGPIIPVVSGTFVEGIRHETVRITGTGSNQMIAATRTGGIESGTSNGFDLLQTTLAGVLVNPCFETGKAPWVFYTNGSATFTSDAPGCGTQRKAHVAVATQGTNVQLYQSGIALQPSQLYRLSFRAYSSTGHDLSVSLGKHVTPYTPYGLSDAVFNLTTVWQEFSIEFTTSGFTSPVADGRLRFWFAPYDASGDHFYVDTVMLAAVTTSSPPAITGQPSDKTVIAGQAVSFSVTATGSLPLVYQWKKNNLNIPGATSLTYTIPLVATGDSGAVFTCVVSNLSGSITCNGAMLTVISAPSNAIVNGGFEDGTAPWMFFSNGSGNIGRVSPGAAGSAYTGRVSISTAGTNVQLFQSNITLEAGMTYKLTFSALSSNGHDMAVFLHQQTSPFTSYGVNNWVVNLTTVWNDYSRVFTASGFTGTVSNARLRFWFAPYDAAGDKFSIDNVVLEKSPVAREAVAVETPLQFALRQNYPNPFNPVTVISYGLPAASQVSLKVYDLLGKEITTLVNEMQDAGFKSVEFDASNLASGVYLYRLQSGIFVDTKKLVVVK